MTVLIGLILAVFVTQMSANPTVDPPEVAIVNGNALFANNMYKELSTKEGNVFFSPISAYAVLSLAYQGAAGGTKDAFAKVLNVPDATSAAEGYYQVINRLNSNQNVTLLMANKVYLMNKFELQDSFKKAATEKFVSEVEKVNFADQVKTADVINHWVEEKTRNKIKDLISSNSLSSFTRLVLVNAIYFKGDWARKFNEQRTQKKPFYINENDHVEVDMMHHSDNFRFKYEQELEATVLELPYTNKDISLIVILPFERTGIQRLEEKLQNTDLTKITENMWSQEVVVQLPKFKIETTINLKDVLTKMGLGVIFNGEADFSNLITGGDQLMVSEVIQKAFIEVNEGGAEAAAATKLRRIFLSASSRFICDHPFSFILQSKVGEKNIILFQGRVKNF